MGSFFKNIINDSRNGMPSVEQKTVSSFVGTAPERQRQHMSADFPVSGIAAIESEATSEKTTLSNSVQPQGQAQISASAEIGDTISAQKIQPNAGRTVDDMTTPMIQHKQQVLAAQQSANESEHADNTDGNDRRPDLRVTPFDYQTEERINSTQSKPVAAQKLISDDYVVGEKNLDDLKNDQQTTDPLFESVRKPEQSITQPAQHKTDHVALDQPVFTESELSTLGSGIDSGTGSGMNPENMDWVDAFQPRNKAAIKHAAAQNGHDASKPPTVVVNSETRIEAHAARSAVVENRKDAYPQVSIGLVNVVVEGPKITQKTQATPSNARRDDHTSRHYLRSL